MASTGLIFVRFSKIKLLQVTETHREARLSHRCSTDQDHISSWKLRLFNLLYYLLQFFTLFKVVWRKLESILKLLARYDHRLSLTLWLLFLMNRLLCLSHLSFLLAELTFRLDYIQVQRVGLLSLKTGVSSFHRLVLPNDCKLRVTPFDSVFVLACATSLRKSFLPIIIKCEF